MKLESISNTKNQPMPPPPPLRPPFINILDGRCLLLPCFIQTSPPVWGPVSNSEGPSLIGTHRVFLCSPETWCPDWPLDLLTPWALTLRVVNMMPSSPCSKWGSIKSSMKWISAPRWRIPARTTTNRNTGKSSSMHHCTGPTQAWTSWMLNKP